MVFKKNYVVHNYELDFRGLALPLSLLNYFQDASGDHATLLGFSVPDLLKRNMTWLLSRYHLKIFAYPRAGETVEVATWPSGRQGLFALRDSEMKNGQGVTVAAATSSWVLWNVSHKRPARPDEHLPEHLVFPRRTIPDSFETLPAPSSPGLELGFRVEMQDIDFNNHVNYLGYMGWALETLPENVLRTHVLSGIEASYRAETFYGDEVVSRSQREDSGGPVVYLHGIFNKANGTELARLRSIWSPSN
jgi:medium-chain acyl-[acyl-carrier-protein] hydrolase